MASTIQLGLEKSDNVGVVENHLEIFERAEELTEARCEFFSKGERKEEDCKGVKDFRGKPKFDENPQGKGEWAR